eukprot:gene26990-13786_t
MTLVEGNKTVITGLHVQYSNIHGLKIVGNDNLLDNSLIEDVDWLGTTTVRRFGNAGIVTSQLSNEISYSHVYDGGLIGNDDACVHADNSGTPCQPDPATGAITINCTKNWHHNW